MTGNDHPSANTSRTDADRGQVGRDADRKRGGRDDADRGQAEQIDFLNGMVILLFGVGLFFAGGSVLLGIGVDSSPDREAATLAADERLVGDLLVADIEDTQLDWDCADAYFEMDADAVCTRQEGLLDTADDELTWLRHSLGVDETLRVNVTVVDDGTTVTSGGVEYRIGPSPPPESDVFESNRFVTFGDGEYYTVLVRVW